MESLQPGGGTPPFTAGETPAATRFSPEPQCELVELPFNTSSLAQSEKPLCFRNGIGHNVLTVDDDRRWQSDENKEGE